MSKNYNIMMFVFEDDRKLQSSFFHDLNGLLKKTNKIPITIIYHSTDFFGSQLIHIDQDSYTAQKIKDIPINYKMFKKEMEDLYNTYYIKGRKNIFYYGGHSNCIFEDYKFGLKTNIFEKMTGLELIILDSFYTAYTNLLSTIIGKTNYVLASSTASPYLGFLSNTFLDILNTPGEESTAKYREIIDLFIKRNSATTKKGKKLTYRTDGVLIDMRKYVAVHDHLQTRQPEKNKKCKLENVPYYYYYDLACLAPDDKKLKELINKCILYMKMNSLAKEFYAKNNITITGLIIGIK